MKSIHARALLALVAAVSLCAHAANLASISVSGPSNVDSQASVAIQFSAIAHWDDGTTSDVTPSASWDTSDINVTPSVMAGQVVFSKLGSVLVKASYSGQMAQMAVTFDAGVQGAWSNPRLACASGEAALPTPLLQLGSRFTGLITSMEPLCDGRVIIANVALARLQVLNVVNGLIEASIQLPSPARRMARIPGGNWLFAALDGGQLARVDLVTGALALVPVASQLTEVAPGAAGEIIVAGKASSTPYLFVYNADTLAQVSSRAIAQVPDRMRFQALGSFAFARSRGSSVLTRHNYDPGAHAFYGETSSGIGQTSLPLAISSDQLRITVADWELMGENPDRRWSTWNAVDPVDVDYRNDGVKLVMATQSSLQLFDVVTHVSDTAWQITNNDSCLADGERNTRWSPSGTRAYASKGCLRTSQASYGVLYFVDTGPRLPSPAPLAEPPPSLSFDCATEDLGALPVGFLGQVMVGASSSLLPACDGRVLIGNQRNNRIETIDVRTAQVIGRTQLEAPPLEIVRVPGTASTIVARLDATRLAVVDMASGSVSYWEFILEFHALSSGGANSIFAILTDPHLVAGDNRSVVRLDVVNRGISGAGSVGGLPDVIEFDPVSNRVFVASPGEVSRLRYDINNNIYLREDASTGLGGWINDLAISPDGASLAVASLASGPQFLLPDADPLNLGHVLGYWIAPRQPSSVAFRPGASQLAFASTFSMTIADIATHGAQGGWTDGLGCESGSVRRVRYSPSGQYLYGLADCWTASRILYVPLGAAVIPPTLPGAPRDFSATQVDVGRIRFTFTPPVSDGGYAIQGYTVSCGGFEQSASSSPIDLQVATGVVYTCSIVARNASGTGPTATTTVTAYAGTFQVDQAYSVKTHGDGQQYLQFIAWGRPFGDWLSIEPRPGPNHLLRIQFTAPVTSVASVQVSDASGNTVGSASSSISGGVLYVTLQGMPEIGRVRVQLNQVNGAYTMATVMGLLRGDVDGNGLVDANDLQGLRVFAGYSASYGPMADQDLSGFFTASDILRIKGRLGNTLP